VPPYDTDPRNPRGILLYNSNGNSNANLLILLYIANFYYFFLALLNKGLKERHH